MSKRTKITATLLVALLALPTVVLADPPVDRRGPGPGARMLRGLDLSEEQRTTIKALFESRRDEMRTMHEAVRAARGDLRRAVHDDAGGEAAVDAAADRLAGAERDLALARAETLGLVRAELDESQLARLDERLERADDGGERRKRHGRRGSGRGRRGI